MTRVVNGIESAGSSGARAGTVAWLRELPPLPRACHEVLAMANDVEVPLPRLAEVMAADPRMSLQALVVANSAMVARREPARTVREAVVTIGASESARIAVGVALLSELGVRRPELSFDAVLSHGLEVARAWSPFGPAEATSGVLVNGPLLALTADAEGFARFASQAGATEDFAALHELEREMWGLTRCEVGDLLAEVWKLPEGLRDVLGEWHVCRGAREGLYESFTDATREVEQPLLRALATR